MLDTNLFSPKEYERNNKTTKIFSKKIFLKNTKIFSITKKVKMKKLYCIICGKYRKFEKPKVSFLLEKTLVLSIICIKCENVDEKIFKEEESIEILKFLV